MAKRLTLQNFIERAKLVPQHVGKNYEYAELIRVEGRLKIKIVCPFHGPFLQRAAHHLEGHGCSACSGRTPLTDTRIDNQLLGRGIIRVSSLVRESHNFLFRCVEDGHEWTTDIYNVFKGSGCPKCEGQARISNEVVDRMLSNKTMIRVGEVTNSHAKIKLRCLVDGCKHEWDATPNGIQQGKGCPKCANVLRLTNEIVDSRLVGRPIQRLGNVLNGRTKIKWRCLKDGCGFEWENTPSSILGKNTGCPKHVENGFNSSKTSIIYVYSIGDLYCGYGITNDFKTRHRVHKASFNRSEMKAELVATFESAGRTAQTIERKLIGAFENVNSHIKGFKRECTHLHNLQSVLEFIDSQLHGSNQ